MSMSSSSPTLPVELATLLATLTALATHTPPLDLLVTTGPTLLSHLSVYIHQLLTEVQRAKTVLVKAAAQRPADQAAAWKTVQGLTKQKARDKLVLKSEQLQMALPLWVGAQPL